MQLLLKRKDKGIFLERSNLKIEKGESDLFYVKRERHLNILKHHLTPLSGRGKFVQVPPLELPVPMSNGRTFILYFATIFFIKNACWMMERMLLTVQYRTNPAGKDENINKKMSGMIYIIFA